MFEFDSKELASTEDTRERVTVFSVDGTEYTRPARFTTAESLGVLSVMAQGGMDAAINYVLMTALGREGTAMLLDIGAKPQHEEAFTKIVNGLMSDMLGRTVDVGPKAEAKPLRSAPARTNGARKRSTKK